MRYYCDYCNTYLKSDSYKSRKEHAWGWRHRENILEKMIEKGETPPVPLGVTAPPPIIAPPSVPMPIMPAMPQFMKQMQVPGMPPMPPPIPGMPLMPMMTMMPPQQQQQNLNSQMTQPPNSQALPPPPPPIKEEQLQVKNENSTDN